MASFDILDALVFPDDPCTPTSPSFLPSGSGEPSYTAEDDYSSYASLNDHWAAYPDGQYTDYSNGAPYGTGIMGLELSGGMSGPSASQPGGGGIELMDIGEHTRPLLLVSWLCLCDRPT